MEGSPHILVVDDNREIRDLLSRFLVKDGFRVSTAHDGRAMRKVLGESTIDLIVLDLMLPGEDGLTLCRQLRAKSEIPVVMLTAKGEEIDRVLGLEMGADDYLAKPFEPRELLLRIQSVLRRLPPEPEAPAEVRLGECRFDLAREQLRRGPAPVHLTAAESSLLKALALNAGAPVSREELRRRCRIGGNTRTIDVQVARLRRKIEPNPKLPRFLHTVRGKGYVLRTD